MKFYREKREEDGGKKEKGEKDDFKTKKEVEEK